VRFAQGCPAAKGTFYDQNSETPSQISLQPESTASEGELEVDAMKMQKTKSGVLEQPGWVQDLQR
jgi:hypothetical protein